MKFGEILKEVRKDHGDSLAKLGEKMEVAFSYIDRIEKGETPVSKTFLEKIIKIYPLQKQKFIKYYLEETLPEEVQKEIGLKIDKSFLGDMKTLISALDKESQKLAFLYIIERLEFESMKKGTYEKIKPMLEKAKEKVNNS